MKELIKKILINCHYGQVFIEAPRSTTREVIIEEARSYFQDKLEKPIIDLPNFSYEVESQWRHKYHEDIDKGNEFIWDCIPQISI